jgi:hypothetical protein
MLAVNAIVGGIDDELAQLIFMLAYFGFFTAIAKFIGDVKEAGRQEGAAWRLLKDE